ncbi:MAG: hypothetical protein ABIH41_03575 [Nanoarchaeota archaeon]
MNKLWILGVAVLLMAISTVSAYRYDSGSYGAQAYGGAYYYPRDNYYGTRYASGSSYIPTNNNYNNAYGGGWTRFGPSYRGGYYGSSNTYGSYFPTGYQSGAFSGSSYNRVYYPRSSAQWYGGCQSDWYYDGYSQVPSRYCVA